ncbi:MAG: hypothetical protein E6772_07535 [Dysgonomonas sp.]|nr:hypothetical protein [Dysgonomonas sp.]
MDKNIKGVTNAIASDIQKIIHTLMDNDSIANNHYSIKELRDKQRKEDVIVKVSGAGGSSTQSVIEVIYDNIIEWDRQPQTGEMPSVSDIKEWAQAKGLKTDNPTISLIRQNLWWSGYSGQPLWDAIEKEIDKNFEDKWSDRIMDVIIKELEQGGRD